MSEADSEQIAHHLNARLLRYRSQPGSEDARALAEDLITAGRFGDARGVAVSAQPDAGDDGELLVLEGRAWFMEHDLVRAQATLLRAVKAAPGLAGSYRWLGEVLLERGDPLRAARTLRRATELDPSDSEAAALAARADYLSEVAMQEAQEAARPAPAAPASPPAAAPVVKPIPTPTAPMATGPAFELADDDDFGEALDVRNAPRAPAAVPSGRPSPFPVTPANLASPVASARPPVPAAPPKAPTSPGKIAAPQGLFGEPRPAPPKVSDPAPRPPAPTPARGSLGGSPPVPRPPAPPAPAAPRTAPGTLDAPRVSSSPGALDAPRTSPGALDAPRTSPGLHDAARLSSPGTTPAPRTSPGALDAPRTSPGLHDAARLSSPGTTAAPRTSPGALDAPRTSPGMLDAPRTSPGALDAPRTSPGALDAPRTSPGMLDAPRTSPGALDAPRTSPGALDAPRTSPGAVDAPRTSPGALDAPRTSPGSVRAARSSSSPGMQAAPVPRSSPGQLSAPGGYEGLQTLSGDDDAPDYPPPSAAAFDDEDDDVGVDLSDVERVDTSTFETDDADADADDRILPGTPPERAPDLELGAASGEPLDADAALEIVRQHGLFEEPQSPQAQWSSRAEIAPTGTRMRNTLIGVWVLSVALVVGGYFGWQKWIERRHARAAAWTAQALEAMHDGDHEGLVDAERLLRMARTAYPASTEVPRAALLLHAERVLEDGQRDLADLQTALKRAASSNVDGPALGVGKAVVVAFTPEASNRDQEIKTAQQGIGSDAFLRYLMGRLAQRLGQPDAVTQLTAAAQADAKLVPAQLALAELDLDAGERAQVLSRLDAVIASRPEHLRARLLRLFASADDADPAATASALDALKPKMMKASASDQLVVALTRARVLRRQGKSEEAGAAVEAAGGIAVDEPRLTAWVAREALALGKLPLAQRAASQALAAAPDVAQYRRLLARILVMRGDGEHALVLLAKLAPDDIDAQIMKAQAALISADPASLRAGLDALTAVQDRAPEQKTQIGALRIRLQAQLEPTPDLVAKASALVQSAPGDADALLALAEAALAAHDAVAANKAITQRIALLPDDANSYYLQGRARRMALDAAGAETSLRKALTLAPGQADALSALAALLLDTGKYAEADAVYETLASRGPTMLEGRLGRIDALLGLRRFDDAQVQLDAVPEAQRNLAAYRMSAASLALARDKPADALTLLRPLVDAPTKKPLVLVLYGDALHAAEQVNAAAGAYEAALAIDPELPEALIGRAEIHLHAERPQDALSILETAQKSLPTRLRPPALRARLLSALGHSYIMRSRRGDDDAARAALREAVQLSGAAPDTFFWLGESLGGKITPEAQAAYQRYLALEPNGKYADRARRALGPLLSAAPPTPLPSTHRSTP